MKDSRKKEDIDKILSLSKEELKRIYAKMSASEIADLIAKLKEVTE